MPALFRFLGYDPLPEFKTLPERLLAKRRTEGWSIRESARKLGVDSETWRDWERGQLILYRNHRVQIARLLDRSAAELHQEMRARRNRSHPRSLAEAI